MPTNTNRYSFDDAMQALADERHITADQIEPRALNRTVYNMMYSAPGCLPDHSSLFQTKAAAIDYAADLYADDAPRGFKTELRRFGIAAADESGYSRVEVCKMKLRELF